MLFKFRKIRYPGENRGPEKQLILIAMDAGFRRHDENEGVRFLSCSVYEAKIKSSQPLESIFSLSLQLLIKSRTSPCVSFLKCFL